MFTLENLIFPSDENGNEPNHFTSTFFFFFCVSEATMRMERRWFPRCRCECPTPVVLYRDVGSCDPRFCGTSEGSIATLIGAKTQLYHACLLELTLTLTDKLVQLQADPPHDQVRP